MSKMNDFMGILFEIEQHFPSIFYHYVIAHIDTMWYAIQLDSFDGSVWFVLLKAINILSM